VKKVISTVLALGMAISLAACGGSSDSAATSAASEAASSAVSEAAEAATSAASEAAEAASSAAEEDAEMVLVEEGKLHSTPNYMGVYGWFVADNNVHVVKLKNNDVTVTTYDTIEAYSSAFAARKNS